MDDPPAPPAVAFPPNPALAPLDFLIGEWRTVGTHPALNGGTVEGHTSFQWHQNGAFLIMRQHIDHPDFPDGVAIFGSDDQAARQQLIYYDTRGVSRIYDLTLGDKTLQWRRLDARFAQTMTVSATADGGLTSHGRLSEDSRAWQDDLAQTFTREGQPEQPAVAP